MTFINAHFQTCQTGGRLYCDTSPYKKLARFLSLRMCVGKIKNNNKKYEKV